MAFGRNLIIPGLSRTRPLKRPRRCWLPLESRRKSCPFRSTSLWSTSPFRTILSFLQHASIGSVRRKSDRRTDKGVVMFGTPNFKALQSFDDDFSNHVRMQPAEIVEGAGARERIGKRIISIERRLGPEYLVLVDHRMWDIVVIDPLHRRAHGNRQFRGREGEIVDGDHVGGILRRYRGHRQHRSNDWTNKNCNDDGTAYGKPGRRGAEVADHGSHVESSINQPASCRRSPAACYPAP